jgi:cell shape-determining protein MreC
MTRMKLYIEQLESDNKNLKERIDIFETTSSLNTSIEEPIVHDDITDTRVAELVTQIDMIMQENMKLKEKSLVCDKCIESQRSVNELKQQSSTTSNDEVESVSDSILDYIHSELCTIMNPTLTEEETLYLQNKELQEQKQLKSQQTTILQLKTEVSTCRYEMKRLNQLLQLYQSSADSKRTIIYNVTNMKTIH